MKQSCLFFPNCVFADKKNQKNYTNKQEEIPKREAKEPSFCKKNLSFSKKII